MILALILAATMPVSSVPVGSGATLCSETNLCVITAVSSPTAALYFGTGTTWCSQSANISKLPLTVSWNSPNLPLCPTDPIPNFAKSIVAVQQSTAYTISYTLNGKAQTPFTVPALPPPPKVQSCTGTLTTDSTSAQTLNITCK